VQVERAQERSKQERARVVQQALAFENRQYSVRRPELPQDRGRGSGVGRCDHGTECDRRRPRHFGYQTSYHDGNCSRRQSHRDDHQSCYWNPVVAQIPWRRVVSGVEQDGCDEERQRQLRWNRKRRPAGQKSEERTTNREKRWIRRADLPRDRGEHCSRDNQHDQEFEFSHVAATAILVSRGRRLYA
jgi:hypothetical protein